MIRKEERNFLCKFFSYFINRLQIVEVCPSSTSEISPGTRLCAYWSQQYRCLYPGTSVEPSEPDPELDEKFVSVEFDDGDSGRIALDDIRLLQPDYPVVGMFFFSFFTPKKELYSIDYCLLFFFFY